MRWWRRLVADESGMVTVEAAYALAAIAAFLVLAVGVLGAVSANIRCTDAVREVARLAAAGEESAVTTGTRIAPSGSSFDVGGDDERVVVVGSCEVSALPGITVSARAVAAREPDAESAG